MIPKPEPTGVGKKLVNETIKLRDGLLKTDITKETVSMAFKTSIASVLSIFKEYIKEHLGIKYQEGADNAKGKTPDSKRKEFTPNKKAVISRANSAYQDFKNAITTSYNNTYKQIAAEIVRKDKNKSVTYELRNRVHELLVKENFIKVEYANGRTIPVDAYAEMVANTASIEAYNTGAIDYAMNNTDLVEMTTIFPTCDICAKYQGRVYSVSGNDKRYPSLYDTVLSKGYNTVHPNCRHEFIPYDEDFDTTEEKKARQEKANKPFEDSRTDKNVKEYQKWQEANRAAREKKNKRLYGE